MGLDLYIPIQSLHFTPLVVSSIPGQGEVYSINLYLF